MSKPPGSPTEAKMTPLSSDTSRPCPEAVPPSPETADRSPALGPSTDRSHPPSSEKILLPKRGSSLAVANAKLSKARSISCHLQQAYDELSKAIEEERDGEEADEHHPGEEMTTLEHRRVSLGVELAKKQLDEIEAEREVVKAERSTQSISIKKAMKRHRELNVRHTSAGDDLWRNQKKKNRMDNPGAARLLQPGQQGASGMAECLLMLYKKSDGLDPRRKRPSTWRRDAIDYYLGSNEYHGDAPPDSVWCHIAGWMHGSLVTAAHIVPFFLDMNQLCEILFGAQNDALEKGGNALLLSNCLKKWFDTYHLVIVPKDPTENPIRRWKVDIISPDIMNQSYKPWDETGTTYLVKDLDGKELQFLGDRRPVSRFLYFHFVMALVRIKDIGRPGWEGVWARYYQQRPFPTPGNYMRKSMLVALATYFQAADMRVVESWIVGHGFDTTPLKLDEDQAMEVARRVHEAVEEKVEKAEEMEDDSDDSGEDEDD